MAGIEENRKGRVGNEGGAGREWQAGREGGRDWVDRKRPGKWSKH